ncbi:HAD-IA family hydrolase [Leptothoe sp. LEGE 181152]|nr:HAD-IA family hydrolase [Leptothoe sp. LEGE 181152]
MVTVFCNGKQFTNIDAVFLDKDGTLANVAAYLQQLGYNQAKLMEQSLPGAYGLTLKALGIDSTGLSASGLLAVGSRQETIIGTAAAAAMAGYPWVKALELAIHSLTVADQQCSPKAAYTPLLPGVLDFLQRLRHVGLNVIMVSADTQSNLEDFVNRYQLQTYFDKLQGTSSPHPTKGAPDFLPAACQSIGLSPGQGMVIGDSTSDLRMAQSTGGFIGYLGGWQPTLSETDILDDECSGVICGFANDFSQITMH